MDKNSESYVHQKRELLQSLATDAGSSTLNEAADQTSGKTWDFFLAHASPDKEHAEKLYRCLTKGPWKSRVFLDSQCLQLGDDWDAEMARAQGNSRVTVVLVSSRTGQSYYQREEIAAAIAMAREDKTQHRVVPVYLDDHAGARDAVPYGLRLKHGLSVSQVGGLEVVAKHLKHLITDLDSTPLQVLAVRAAKLTAAGDTTLSLRAVAEATGKAATAVHGFTSALKHMVASGFGVVDCFKDRWERERLRRLLRGLMVLENHQAPFPMLLREYQRFGDWRHVTWMIAQLIPAVAELTELLAAEQGDFMISAQDAYKALLFGLKGRALVYQEITALPPPESKEDLAYLGSIADEYDRMIDELVQAQKAIGVYLRA